MSDIIFENNLESILGNNSELNKVFYNHTTTIPKDEFVYSPGKKHHFIYFIIHGKVKTGTIKDDDKEIISGILQDGEVFGELVLLDRIDKDDFALTMKKSEIAAFTQSEIRHLMGKFPVLSEFLMRFISLRIAEMEDRLKSLIFKDTNSRILEFIIKTVEGKGQKAGFEWIFRPPYTHRDIASLTSTSRQSVTMVLNDLRNRNLIDFDRKRILVKDMDAMKLLLQNNLK